MNRILKKLSIFILILLILPPLLLAAQDNGGAKRIALIGFENMDEDNEHDYLSALITAVIREDLSNTEGIILLERSLMNRVLEEQKMQISGLFDDRDAVEAGRLLGSDYLSGGGYIVMDTEVLIDVTLIDVETGRVISFSSRGNSEDIIHQAAEKIIRELTGKRVILRTAETNRPLIKQTLMPPGSLKLFSPLIDARIYIDGEFYGYTKGNGRIPIEVELTPGVHTVKTDLGGDFGVIIEPEIRFEKWEQEFTIESGKSIVLEDPTRHFNDRLYRLRKLVQDDKYFYFPEAEPFDVQHEFSFTDRSGNPVEGSLTIHFTPTETAGLNAQIMLIYGYDRKVFDLECERGKNVELEKTIGLVDLEVEISCSYRNRAEADWSLRRNDVHQGMHRE